MSTGTTTYEGTASANSIHERTKRLNERLRAEFIAGAEEQHRRLTGRPMTSEELERVLRR